MKIFSLIFCLLVSFYSRSQNSIIDNLNLQLRTEKLDTNKAKILYKLSYQYQSYKPDSALILAQQSYSISIKNNFPKGISGALGQIAGAFNRLGNYPKALEYYLKQIVIDEQASIPYNIAADYINIALVYTNEKDFFNALNYSFKADSIINANQLKEISLYSLMNIGDTYEKKNMLDSALFYTTKCLTNATDLKEELIKKIRGLNDLTKINANTKDQQEYLTDYKQTYFSDEINKTNNDIAQCDGMIGTLFNNLGNIFYKKNNFSSAFYNYQKALPSLEKMQDFNLLSECKTGLAKIYKNSGNNDSAMSAAREAFKISYTNGLLSPAMNTSKLLAQLFEDKNELDSAFYYQSIVLGLKDSIENTEKAKQVQSITSEEQIRQKEIVLQKEEEEEKRKQSLQMLAIGIIIPIFFFLSVYISRKKVHKKVIEISGIISILLVFEYITLMLHPFIVHKTNHTPVYEIIIFVAIAAVLSPLHHKIEKWLVERLSHIHNKHSINRNKVSEKNNSSDES